MCPVYPVSCASFVLYPVSCILYPLSCILCPVSCTNRVCADNLVGLAFLYSISYIKSISTHEKIFAVGKKVAQMPLLTYFFVGLGWPCVGEFDGFIIIFTCFPTQQNSVNRKHATVYRTTAVDRVVVVSIYDLPYLPGIHEAQPARKNVPGYSAAPLYAGQYFFPPQTISLLMMHVSTRIMACRGCCTKVRSGPVLPFPLTCARCHGTIRVYELGTKIGFLSQSSLSCVSSESFPI